MNTLDQLKADAEAALLKLQWPSNEAMRLYVQKLLVNPGSCILIGVEQSGEGLIVGRAWLSACEREAIKKALRAVNRKRVTKGETLTTESP